MLYRIHSVRSDIRTSSITISYKTDELSRIGKFSVLTFGIFLGFNRINGVSRRMESEKFAATVKSKVNQLDQTMVTNLIQETRGKILKMYRKGVYSAG